MLSLMFRPYIEILLRFRNVPSRVSFRIGICFSITSLKNLASCVNTYFDLHVISSLISAEVIMGLVFEMEHLPLRYLVLSCEKASHLSRKWASSPTSPRLHIWQIRFPWLHMTEITVMRVAKNMSFLTQQQQQSAYHFFKVINPAPLTLTMYLNIII